MFLDPLGTGSAFRPPQDSSARRSITWIYIEAAEIDQSACSCVFASGLDHERRTPLSMAPDSDNLLPDVLVGDPTLLHSKASHHR